MNDLPFFRCVRRLPLIGFAITVGVHLPAAMADLPPFTEENIRRAEPGEVRRAKRVEPRVIHVYHVHNMHQNFVRPMWPQLAARINKYQEHVYNYIANFPHAEKPEVFVEWWSENQDLSSFMLFPNIGNIHDLSKAYGTERNPQARKRAEAAYRAEKERLEAEYRYLPGGDYRAFRDGFCVLRPGKNARAFELSDAMSLDNLYRTNFNLFVLMMEEKEDIALDLIAKHATGDHVVLVYGGAHDFGNTTSFYRSHVGGRTMTQRNNVREWNEGSPNVKIKLINVDPTR